MATMHTQYNLSANYPGNNVTSVPTTGGGTVPTLPSKAYPAKNGKEGSSGKWNNPATGKV